jgi:predicted AlkP superfamily phosphohydrolase/phosphomutase
MPRHHPPDEVDELIYRATTSKVMMIGLDAASLDFIQASLPSLPNLRRAVESGRLQRLRSRTSELLHAAVWPTLYTGQPPGTHGVYYHMQWDPAAMRLRQINDWLYCEPFWCELERRGRRVVAMDVPMSWPSRLRQGLEITDWGTHDRMATFRAASPELAADVRRRFGSYPIGSEVPVRKSWRQLARMRDEIGAGTRRRAELACWMLGLREWDFAIVVFSETHRGGHLFWPTPEAEGIRHPAGALLSIYRAVDDAIGQLLGSVPAEDTTFIIFAAHGMGRNASQEHFTRPIMDRVNRRFPDVLGVPAGRGPRQRSLMRLLRERVPARIQHAIGQMVPLEVRDFVVNHAITSGHDWTRTPALAILASAVGYVQFSLRGREKHGLLDPDGDTFQRYSKWMHECFESFRIGDTDEPLVKELTLTRDLFPGPRQSFLPDVVVSWTGGPTASRIRSPILGTIEAALATGRPGNHDPDGFSIVIEPGGERGVAPTLGDVLDLKPLVFRRLAGA